MKVRITFETGDCVEPVMIGRTFENSGKKYDAGKGKDQCAVCAFKKSPYHADHYYSACVASTGCVYGAFVEVTETQTKEEAK